MRTTTTAMCLILTAGLVGLAGCGPGSGADPNASPDYTTKDIVACQAVQEANNRYVPQVRTDGGATDANTLRGWSDEISSAAVALDDPVLKAQLLNLSSTVQDWVVRPPSDVQVLAFTDNLGRACGKYLNPPTATPTG